MGQSSSKALFDHLDSDNDGKLTVYDLFDIIDTARSKKHFIQPKFFLSIVLLYHFDSSKTGKISNRDFHQLVEFLSLPSSSNQGQFVHSLHPNQAFRYQKEFYSFSKINNSTQLFQSPHNSSENRCGPSEFLDGPTHFNSAKKFCQPPSWSNINPEDLFSFISHFQYSPSLYKVPSDPSSSQQTHAPKWVPKPTYLQPTGSPRAFKSHDRKSYAAGILGPSHSEDSVFVTGVPPLRYDNTVPSVNPLPSVLNSHLKSSFNSLPKQPPKSAENLFSIFQTRLDFPLLFNLPIDSPKREFNSKIPLVYQYDFTDDSFYMEERAPLKFQFVPKMTAPILTNPESVFDLLPPPPPPAIFQRRYSLNSFRTQRWFHMYKNQNSTRKFYRRGSIPYLPRFIKRKILSPSRSNGSNGKIISSRLEKSLDFNVSSSLTTSHSAQYSTASETSDQDTLGLGQSLSLQNQQENSKSGPSTSSATQISSSQPITASQPENQKNGKILLQASKKSSQNLTVPSFSGQNIQVSVILDTKPSKNGLLDINVPVHSPRTIKTPPPPHKRDFQAFSSLPSSSSHSDLTQLSKAKQFTSPSSSQSYHSSSDLVSNTNSPPKIYSVSPFQFKLKTIWNDIVGPTPTHNAHQIFTDWLFDLTNPQDEPNIQQDTLAILTRMMKIDGVSPNLLTTSRLPNASDPDLLISSILELYHIPSLPDVFSQPTVFSTPVVHMMSSPSSKTSFLSPLPAEIKSNSPKSSQPISNLDVTESFVSETSDRVTDNTITAADSNSSTSSFHTTDIAPVHVQVDPLTNLKLSNSPQISPTPPLPPTTSPGTFLSGNRKHLRVFKQVDPAIQIFCNNFNHFLTRLEYELVLERVLSLYLLRSALNHSLFFKKYRLFTCLGSGATSIVFRMMNISSQTAFAGKFIFSSKTSKAAEEIRVAKHLRGHPFITSYIADHRTSSFDVLVTEPALGGSLAHVINKRKRKTARQG